MDFTGQVCHTFLLCAPLRHHPHTVSPQERAILRAKEEQREEEARQDGGKGGRDGGRGGGRGIFRGRGGPFRGGARGGDWNGRGRGRGPWRDGRGEWGGRGTGRGRGRGDGGPEAGANFDGEGLGQGEGERQRRVGDVGGDVGDEAAEPMPPRRNRYEQRFDRPFLVAVPRDMALGDTAEGASAVDEAGAGVSEQQLEARTPGQVASGVTVQATAAAADSPSAVDSADHRTSASAAVAPEALPSAAPQDAADPISPRFFISLGPSRELQKSHLAVGHVLAGFGRWPATDRLCMLTPPMRICVLI